MGIAVAFASGVLGRIEMAGYAGSSPSTAWHILKTSLGYLYPHCLCPPPWCLPWHPASWLAKVWALQARFWGTGIQGAIHLSVFFLAGGVVVQIKFQFYPL